MNEKLMERPHKIQCCVIIVGVHLWGGGGGWKENMGE